MGGFLKASKPILLTYACLFWFLPGIKILYVGISRWTVAESLPMIGVWFSVALIMFSFFIFPRVYTKNTDHVLRQSGELHPLYRCFRPGTWVIIGIMICFGIWLRHQPFVPNYFVCGFYSGLGIAMLITTYRYILLIRQLRNK